MDRKTEQNVEFSLGLGYVVFALVVALVWPHEVGNQAHTLIECVKNGCEVPKNE